MTIFPWARIFRNLDLLVGDIKSFGYAFSEMEEQQNERRTGYRQRHPNDIFFLILKTDKKQNYTVQNAEHQQAFER